MFRQKILKFLAKRGWQDDINLFVYANRARNHRENMEYAFTDSAGKQYFYYPDMGKIPIPLNEKFQELLMQLEAKIPGRDLDLWIDAFAGEMNDPNRKDKVTRAGYWLGVLKDRRSIQYDPTILMEIAALTYIREDENQYTYNEAIHKEKFDMLWKDSKEGALLYDFFRANGLKAFMPSTVDSSAGFQKSLETILVQINRFNELVTATSTYVLKYATNEKTTEKAL